MEYPQAFNRITRRARKEHRCCECLGIIRKKETYCYCSGIWDSRPDSFKTCNDCVLLRFQIELTLPRAWDEGLAIGEVLEWLQEAQGPEVEGFCDALGQIMTMRKSKWKLGESSRRLFSFTPGETLT
jgi:hypothetical protein